MDGGHQAPRRKAKPFARFFNGSGGSRSRCHNGDRGFGLEGSKNWPAHSPEFHCWMERNGYARRLSREGVPRSLLTTQRIVADQGTLVTAKTRLANVPQRKGCARRAL